MLILNKIKLKRDKKGLSEIVGYVMLITITMALSVLVYNWLRGYVQPGNTVECPEDVSLTIESFSCSNQSLNITIKNRGLFSTDGFSLKVNDRNDSGIGLYNLPGGGNVALKPGEVFNGIFRYSDAEENGFKKDLKSIKLIEVQPFVINKKEPIYCKKLSSQRVDC